MMHEVTTGYSFESNEEEESLGKTILVMARTMFL